MSLKFNPLLMLLKMCNILNKFLPSIIFPASQWFVHFIKTKFSLQCYSVSRVQIFMKIRSAKFFIVTWHEMTLKAKEKELKSLKWSNLLKYEIHKFIHMFLKRGSLWNICLWLAIIYSCITFYNFFSSLGGKIHLILRMFKD